MSYNKETGMYQGYIYCITNTVNGKKYIGQTRTTVEQRWYKHKVDSKDKDTALYNAMRKYGTENFEIETIFSISDRDIEKIKDSLNFLEMYFIAKYDTLCNNNKGYNLTKGGDNRSIRLLRPVKQYDLELNYLTSYNSILEASIYTDLPYDIISSNCSHKQMSAGSYVFCYENEEPISPLSRFGFENIDIKLYTINQLKALVKSCWNGESITQYNLYGEIMQEYNNPIDLSIKYDVPIHVIMKYLGKNRRFNETILLYKSQEFDYDEIYKEIRPVAVYDLKGNYIARYISIVQAANGLNCKAHIIGNAIKRGTRYNNYLFCYYGENPPETHRKRGREIIMLNENGEKIKEFICVKQVADFFNMKDVHVQISKSMKTNTPYKGYYWKYKDEVTVL